MKNTFCIPKQSTPYFTFPAHTITWKRDLSHLKTTLSSIDLDTFLSLYALATKNPKKAKRDVEIFRSKHPDHPEVLNLLTYIYLSCGKMRQGNGLIEKNYAKNSNYLFAKINFADLCLRRKNPQCIPHIFNKKFSLPELYPNKQLFHVSEFRGLMSLMGFYQIAIGNDQAAKQYHYLVAHIAPNHPATKILEKKIYATPTIFKRFILNLLPFFNNEKNQQQEAKNLTFP